MRVTINDVAKAANVSPSTVSRVIANNPRIGQETREKVFKIMKEMNYHPNIIARSLANKSTRIVGVVVPANTEKAFQHPFYPELLRGIGSVATKYKYNILLSSINSPSEEKDVIRELSRSGITEGVILLASRVNDPTIKELKKIHFPFVVVGRPENEDEVNWVDNNNVNAGYEITKHFIKNGHKRIAFLGLAPEFIVTTDRYKGYKKALEEAGLGIDSGLVLESKFIEHTTDIKVMKQILTGSKRPTGIVACDDFLAFGAMKLINECGLKVPEDISVAGFNNVPLASYSIPPLTTVEVNAFGLGAKAFELLHTSISSDYQSFNRTIVPTEIITRESVQVLG
ncbi:MAG: LacI family transcriptional regulator [Clostridia bacterium]|nr:LacI family transcriptional regulator [Clostridia bacterium]